MDENDLERSEDIWVKGRGGRVLQENLFLEREKGVVQFEWRRELKSSEIIELYGPEVSVPCIWLQSNW